MVQTQKDHVEAYSFLIGRMTSALVLGDASHLDVPAKRTWNGLLGGALLALLIVVGFFVYGLIAHHTGGSAPSAPVGGTGGPSHTVRIPT
ncbi:MULTISPECIES: type VII secretion protein EccB [unclassified Amycolatopsis]|uniref:type VII secretion protein EccB n=1 Tax=unclassified Amycolatopsis TaxID=2618356 RepID=UPI001C699953|nr:type VII secretion protein EccB [Amycolatopsis sp. DSM 110486]QYN23801.1 type VII secretion protein EccB [Amycolatopsis sp. DSM 110486]